MSQNSKKEIIAYIVELMKDEMSYSQIRDRVVSKYGISVDKADEYVKNAFETVSFLVKNTDLSPQDKRGVVVGGLIVSLLCSALYALPIIYSGYNLVLFIILYSFLISKSIYLLGRKKSGIFLQITSAIFTTLCYLIGEFAIYIYGLRKELFLRGIEPTNNTKIILKGFKPFITEYLTSKGISEYMLVFCAVLLSVSYFTSVRLKRIRD